MGLSVFKFSVDQWEQKLQKTQQILKDRFWSGEKLLLKPNSTPLQSSKLHHILYFSYLLTAFLSIFVLNAFRGWCYFTSMLLFLSTPAACRNVLKSVSWGNKHLLCVLQFSRSWRDSARTESDFLWYQGLTVIIRTCNNIHVKQ